MMTHTVLFWTRFAYDVTRRGGFEKLPVDLQEKAADGISNANAFFRAMALTTGDAMALILDDATSRD